MSIETLLGFRNIDSTENINARLSGLIPKGILKGGLVVPEPASMQVRIKGTPGENVVVLAFAKDGMLIREKSEEHVLPVTAGITNVIILRAKYLESQPPQARFEVMPLGAWQNDPDKDSLIRLAAVSPAADATLVVEEDINGSFRDSIEGFTRRVLRGIVDTREDLPAVSGSPAVAEMNFLNNDFSFGTTVSVSLGLLGEQFSIVKPISFGLANPAVPGVSRINASQVNIDNVSQAVSGVVTVSTIDPHGFQQYQSVRISGNSALGANSLWIIADVLSPTAFKFTASVVGIPFYGVGGSVVDQVTPATVTVKTAPGILHDVTAGMQVVLGDVTDATFNGIGTVLSVPNSSTVIFQQIGYPTGNSGNGVMTKIGFSLPLNAVEIGASASTTASNFETVFQASTLSADVKATAIGSSVQLSTIRVGTDGNAYTIAKDEPGRLPAESSIVLSGSSFEGGADSVPGLATTLDIQVGDIYVVLHGEVGSMELWGYDGGRFVNLTSSSTATLLDFHRRNLLTNEKHLVENEKAALAGTVGTPSATNRYVTEEDTSVLTSTLAAALQGADDELPSGSNKFLTEARWRGERSSVAVPSGQQYVQLPAGERWVVGGQILKTATVSVANPAVAFLVGHGLADGDPVFWSTSGNLPTGLLPDTVYYVKSPALDTFNLAATSGGPAISTSGTQTGVHTLHSLDAGAAAQYFNVVFTDSIKYISPFTGGLTEYTNQDFAAIRVIGLYTDAALTVPLNPADPFLGSDYNGLFPRLDAASLGHPTTLYAKLSAIPDNGSCSVLYTKANKERTRKPPADTLAGPQTITTAELRDIANKVGELRFNAGIGVSGSPGSRTVVQFPASLFAATNVQNLTFRRTAGSKFITESAAFSIDFRTGTGTVGIVNTFTAVAFPSANQWTRYLLSIDRDSMVTAISISDILEKSTDVAFASGVTPAGVSYPSLLSRDGSYVFASVAVQSNATNTGINDIEISSIELYPYQGTNSLPLSQPIVCGDGLVGGTTGHFTGSDSIQRAINWASPGHTIKIQTGTYDSAITITKNDITLDAESGTYLQRPLGTVLTVSGDRFRGKNLRFKNCSIAVAVLAGASDFLLEEPVFDTTVLRKYSCTASLYDSSLKTHPAVRSMSQNIATWTVTDGVNGNYLGCFNSPDGIQQAHDAAADGDQIVVYPGSYNSVSWTKNNLDLRGFSGPSVLINGASGGSGSCLIVTGSGNQFSNFTLTNGAFGIDCGPPSVPGGTRNTFDNTVAFTASVANYVRFPTTAGQKHYNYHPLVSGTDSCVTVGDGSSSWGDYVGQDAINLALQIESINTAVTKIRTIKVKPGTYIPINPGGVTFSGFTIEGSGPMSVIQATAPSHPECIKISGNENKIAKFFLLAANNGSPTVNYSTVGVRIEGLDNTIEDIWFDEINSGTKITPNKKYYDSTGSGRNRFLPSTGYPTRFVTWVVGDGTRSFGEYNGQAGIEAALNNLSIYPQGLLGSISNVGGGGSFCDFEDLNPDAPIIFSTLDLYRYLTISGITGNAGNFKVVQNISDHKVRLQRFDGGTFANATALTWYFLVGAKLTVLPGTYSPFTIQSNKHDIEIEAWAGGDSLIAGEPTDGTLLTVLSNRCKISGFRFVGGIPGSAVAVALAGSDNVFENNRYETATRFIIGANARGNRILDAAENPQKTAYTVSAYPSRADFVGTTYAAIQAAVDAAAADSHVTRVFIGSGTYTLTQTVNIPVGVTVFGSGYSTQLLGSGTGFAAFTLQDAGGIGGQTVSGIRFNTFTNSIDGTANEVCVFGNWFDSAPIAVTVTGQTTINN